jgi:hypothetical protein
MTAHEALLPSAMVPGLVTVEDKKGNRQNLYPVDAKEAIATGEYTLVENGSIEAARMAATPLRSGMANNIPKDNVIVEVAGVAGSVVASSDEDAVAEAIEAGEGADAKPNDGAIETASAQDARKAAESAAQPKTAAEKAQARSNAQAKSGGGADAEAARAAAAKADDTK